jgi:uncharacterized repeat protein (TIGR04052 family)
MRRHTLLVWILFPLAACGDDDSAADSRKDAGRSDAIQTAGDSSGRGGTGEQRSSTGGRSGSSAQQSPADAGSKDPGSNPKDADPSDNQDASATSSDSQAITIRFRGKFGERALNCSESYELPSLPGARVSPGDFRFYVQEVRLTTAAGKEAPVVFDERPPVQTRDVALIDFTDETGHCGSGTTEQNTTITGKVPRGDYTGILFMNGVPESVNHQDLVDGKPPLDDATTHWGWTTGYRFVLSAVAVEPGETSEADGGVIGAGGTSFIHVGAGGCSGATTSGFTCSRPNRNRVVLPVFDVEKNVIVADLARVFDKVDLSQPLECHGPSSAACGPAYTALGLNAADGSARKDQQVFRVE